MRKAAEYNLLQIIMLTKKVCQNNVGQTIQSFVLGWCIAHEATNSIAIRNGLRLDIRTRKT